MAPPSTRSKFLMVDELASLVKKNDASKSLILSVEDLLVEYLEGGRPSLGGVIDLVPMGSFDRMLVHRLADISGFSHHSVGEGANKHVVLERNPDTSVPDTLLSRMLWKTRKWEIKESPEIYNVLMGKGVLPSQKVDGCALDQADKSKKLALSSRDTQGQVYELVSMIEKNHSSKCLVLSVEELLVNYLEEDEKDDEDEEDDEDDDEDDEDDEDDQVSSSDEVLELIPMDSFNRMLVHRLANIFRFSSYSVGEGKDRHVVLERCSETSIPDLLVSRLLWKTRKWETLQPPTTYDVLLQKEASPEKDHMLGDDHTIPCAPLGREDKAEINLVNNETDTNPSKKMKVACTTMPEVHKSGEEIPTMDGRSQEAQRKNNSNPLAVLKNDTPDNFLKL